MDHDAEDEVALRCQEAVQFTGTGKVMHRQAGKMHLNEHKPSTRTRRLDGDVVLAPGDAAKAKKLLGKSS